MSESTVRIGLVLPDVMGTYGDSGNALILRQRLRMRGLDAEIVEITLSDPVPDSLDVYTLGGAEDAAQRRRGPLVLTQGREVVGQGAALGVDRGPRACSRHLSSRDEVYRSLELKLHPSPRRRQRPTASRSRRSRSTSSSCSGASASTPVARASSRSASSGFRASTGPCM